MSQKAQARFSVTTNRYSSDHFYLEPNLQFMLRKHDWKERTTLIETYGSSWLLFVGNPEPGQVEILSNERDVRGEGPMAIFVPPFSLVKWRINPGHLEWGVFHSKQTDQRLPKKAVCFSWNTGRKVESLNDILELFEENLNSICVENGTDSPVASRVKTYLAKEFLSDSAMPEVAKELGLSYSSMTHSFRRAYGLSPLDYRGKLRVFFALEKMLLDRETATQTCHSAGYSDFSTFYRQFQRTLNASPSQFVLKTPNDPCFSEKSHAENRLEH